MSADDNPPAGTPAEAARHLAAARVELGTRLVDVAAALVRTYNAPGEEYKFGFSAANALQTAAEALLVVLRDAVRGTAARR